MAKKKKGTEEDQLSAEDLGIPLKSQTTTPTIEKEVKIPVSSPRDEKKSSYVNLETLKKNASKTDFVQSSCNIGMVGHVDHGKTTLVKALSGTWTERYADEINRGITIKLGYAEGAIMQCPKCGRIIAEAIANNMRKDKSTPKGMCPDCNVKLTFRRRVSFVDAPGHEILMATMLSGASLMDGAILLISANESCPQPQTREHLAALEIAKIDNIIIVQSKIDAVGKERAYQHYQEIKKFVKGTIAEKAPIIPVSAVFDANIDLIYKLIEENIKSPELDEEAPFLFNIARSFDVNKPGTEIENLKGGVIGGSIVSGYITVGQEIEIRPGLKKKEGKYTPIFTHVRSIYEGANSLEFARPGGLIALGTELDPSNTRTDQLIGSVAGIPGTLPEIKYVVDIEAHLLEKVLGSEEVFIVDPLRKNESLMIVTGTALSAGTVEKIGKQNLVTLNLKRPICALEGSIVALSRRINNRFRLIGYGYLV